MFLQLFFLSAICAGGAVAADLLPKDCPPNSPSGPAGPNILNVTKLSITGCTAFPCTFVKSKTYYFGITIVFNAAGTPTTKWQYMSIAVTKLGPVKILEGDMCPTLVGATCADIKPGAELHVKFTQRVDEYVPVYDGDLRVILTKDDVPEYCGQITISVKEKHLSDTLGPVGGGLIGHGR